jgi:hypothetical protein
MRKGVPTRLLLLLLLLVLGRAARVEARRGMTKAEVVLAHRAVVAAKRPSMLVEGAMMVGCLFPLLRRGTYEAG